MDDWGLGDASGACDVCLPSGDAALDFARTPTVATFVPVVGTFLLRGVLVGTGLFLAGARGKDFWVYTAAATGAIEAGVLLWAAGHAGT